jgi:hypothetical protein
MLFDYLLAGLGFLMVLLSITIWRGVRGIQRNLGLIPLRIIGSYFILHMFFIMFVQDDFPVNLIPMAMATGLIFLVWMGSEKMEELEVPRSYIQTPPASKSDSDLEDKEMKRQVQEIYIKELTEDDD